jgi:GNAT superfamily N-acetyltransferase
MGYPSTIPMAALASRDGRREIRPEGLEQRIDIREAAVTHNLESDVGGGRGEEIPIRWVGTGYANDAVCILREAAAWALSRGTVVWRTDELREQDFREAALRGELVMGFNEGQAVATMLLQSSDPIYWPEIAPNTSLFLHKIAVRRAHAGRGWLGRLIEFADQNARQRDIRWLRLDTLHGSFLRHLYEQHGFSAIDEPPVRHLGRSMIRMQRSVSAQIASHSST